QNSDVTYRLFDYGRPRELHLDKAMQVTNACALDVKPVSLPIDCPFFYTDLLSVDEPFEYANQRDGESVLIVLDGQGTMAGDAYRLGEAWLIPPGGAPFSIEPHAQTRLLRTWVP
ncbi:MAG: hypothetical protein JO022_15655, partial [Acidobacteriaceae bacterium]|nr:hypothetical protein [Acidobacteriaceae bacterium]